MVFFLQIQSLKCKVFFLVFFFSVSHTIYYLRQGDRGADANQDFPEDPYLDPAGSLFIWFSNSTRKLHSVLIIIYAASV